MFVATLCLAAALLASREVSETVERTLPLGHEGAVFVTNVNGSVTISASDGDQVHLQAVKRADDDDGLNSIRIDVDEYPRKVAIKTTILKRGWFPFFRNGGSVDYELRVPRDASVTAKSVNGSIAIQEVAGDLRAETVNGAVNVMAAAGGVKARTVNGSLKVMYSAAESGRGHAFETVNGSVQVWLPSDVTGSFRAKTVNGSIKTDLPLTVSKSKYGRRQSIDEQIGENGSNFEIATINGSIRIREN